MSNTVERKGEVYETGKIYEFTNNGEFCIDILIGVRAGGVNKDMFIGLDDDYTEIREPLTSLGTITKAPVKLIDGEAYQFEYNGKVSTGCYGDSMKRLYNQDGFISASVCTNIKHLTVGEK